MNPKAQIMVRIQPEGNVSDALVLDSQSADLRSGGKGGANTLCLVVPNGARPNKRPWPPFQAARAWMQANEEQVKLEFELHPQLDVARAPGATDLAIAWIVLIPAA